MDRSEDSNPHLTEASKRVARQALVICENRLELLLIEVEEERNQILRALWMGLAAALFGILAAVTLTAVIVLACWQWSPIGILCLLTVLYAGVGGFLFAQLAKLRKDWRTLPHTFDELRKDRECLDKSLN